MLSQECLSGLHRFVDLRLTKEERFEWFELNSDSGYFVEWQHFF